MGVFLSYKFPKMRAVNPHQQQSGAGKHKREKETTLMIKQTNGRH